MKKILGLLFLVLALLCVSGCSRTYKVTFEIYSGQEESQIITKGETIQNFTPKLEGHTFIAWLYNDEEFDPSTPIEDNITLQAYWSLNEYDIRFMSDGEVYQAFKLAYGSILKAPDAPKKEDYLFLGWLKAGSEAEFPTTVTANLDYSAKWVKDSEYKPQLKVSFNSTGAKTEYDDIIIHRLDEMPELPSPSFSGHEFLGWYLDDEEIKEGDIIYAMEDFTLIAKWK